MAKILAIDPGNEYSAYVGYDTESREIVCKGKVLNEVLLELIEECVLYGDDLAIEMPACYGMAVGGTVMHTCRWVGIFQHAFELSKSRLVYRKAQNKEDGIEGVCMHICKNNRAKDSNIRQAIIDRYPATGGGKTPQVGTKSQPGPLYGVSKDVWAALAVAITFAETYREFK
jgi:hypothetical protein